METNKNAQILAEYKERHKDYADFATCVEGILRHTLKQRKISIHSINSRSKSIDSLEGKIARPEKSYISLGDITDLAGIRVTTYFTDTIDEVLAVIDKEFQVDSHRSVDKRIGKSPEVFGYSSVHKICTLNPSRSSLSEYQRFHGLLCEIQVRSVLQHTWAEIEHDLGYKTNIGLPVSLKRRFAKLAALLELADDEFMSLRDDIETYRKSIQGAANKKPETIEINTISLHLFLREDQTVLEIENQISSTSGVRFGKLDAAYVHPRIKELHEMEVKTIDQLQESLNQNSGKIIAYTQKMINLNKWKTLPRGFSVFALSLVLAGQLSTQEETQAALGRIGIQKINSKQITKVAREVNQKSAK